MRGKLVERHGIVVPDAAAPDLLPEAVEEGDGEVLLLQPVVGGLLERRYGERQAPGCRPATLERQAFACELDADALQARDMKPVHEHREGFERIPRALPAFVERGIDEGIEGEKGVRHPAPDP